MKVFTSWIRGALLLLFMQHILLGMFVAFIMWLMNWEIRLSVEQLLIFSFCYLAIIYLYIGLTNHDFIITPDSIEAINRVPGFKKNIKIQHTKIKSIFIKDDWADSFLEKFKKATKLGLTLDFLGHILIPGEYKWIKIITNDNVVQRFYCFGMEYDCYDENTFTPTVDEFYNYLKNIGLPVSWVKGINQNQY